MKQKKLSVWMLDTGFVQQLVVRLFTLCSSLQPSEASTASQSLIPLLLLDLCSGKGREQRPSLGNSHCGLLICPQPEPSLKVTSQHQEVLSCTLSQLVNSSKWWVKLWNIKMRFFPPFLITFFFSVQISKKSLLLPHTAGAALTKCFSLQGTFSTSVTKLESQLKQGKIYRNICSQYIMYICTGSFKNKGNQHKAALSEVFSNRSCCHGFT